MLRNLSINLFFKTAIFLIEFFVFFPSSAIVFLIFIRRILVFPTVICQILVFLIFIRQILSLQNKIGRMGSELKCNIIRCRKQLVDKAIITACSRKNIFDYL